MLQKEVGLGGEKRFQGGVEIALNSDNGGVEAAKEEGEEDGVDRERCWYVKEGLFVAKRDWRLMLTVDWREGGNGIAMK